MEVTRAVYDAARYTVTLHFAERLSIHHPYGLTVIGTGRQGLINSDHEALDSVGNNPAGCDFHMKLTWRELVLGHVSREFMNRYHILPKGSESKPRSADSRSGTHADPPVVHSTGSFTRSVAFPVRRQDGRSDAVSGSPRPKACAIHSSPSRSDPVTPGHARPVRALAGGPDRGDGGGRRSFLPRQQRRSEARTEGGEPARTEPRPPGLHKADSVPDVLAREDRARRPPGRPGSWRSSASSKTPGQASVSSTCDSSARRWRHGQCAVEHLGAAMFHVPAGRAHISSADLAGGDRHAPTEAREEPGVVSTPSRRAARGSPARSGRPTTASPAGRRRDRDPDRRRRRSPRP